MVEKLPRSEVPTVDDKEVGIPRWRYHCQQNRNQVLRENPRKWRIERLVARKERRVRENSLTSQFLDD